MTKPNSKNEETVLPLVVASDAGAELWVDATQGSRSALDLAIDLMDEYPEVFKALAGGAEGNGLSGVRTGMDGEDEALAICCAIHDASLERFGGVPGIRDKGLLDSALSQPFQSVFGQDLCPTVEDKAARLAYGITKNHPFLDGNKRTACACMVVYLQLNGRYFRPRSEELLEAVLFVAGGTVSCNELAAWLKLR